MAKDHSSAASPCIVHVPARFVAPLREELRLACERAEDERAPSPCAEERDEDELYDAALDVMFHQLAYDDDPRSPSLDRTLVVPPSPYGVERLHGLLAHCLREEIVDDLRDARPHERASVLELLDDCHRLIDQLATQ